MNKQIAGRKTDKDKASEVLGCPEHHLEYFAWPQAFGSTAGPFGGIGGQAITTFTVEAWSDGRRRAAVFCCGKLIKVVENFEFQTSVVL